MKLFEKLDLFSYRINFYHRNNIAFSSCYSVVTSILTYTMLIYFVHYFSKDLINKGNPRINYFETEFDETVLVFFNNFIKSISFEVQGNIVKKGDFSDGTGKTSSPQHPSNSYNQTNHSNQLDKSTTNVNNDQLSQNHETNTERDEFLLAPYLEKHKIRLDQLIKFQMLISDVNEDLTIIEDESDVIKKVYTLDLIGKDNFNFLDKSQFIFKSIVSNESVFNMNEKNYIFQTKYSNLTKDVNIDRTNLSNFKFGVKQETKIYFRFLIDLDLLDKNDLKLEIIKFDREFITKDSQINQEEEQFFSYSLIKKSLRSLDSPNFINIIKYTYAFYEVIDDSGLIFSSKTNELEFNKRAVTPVTFDVRKSRKTMEFLEIDFYNIKMVYIRVYKKLQNVFADLGGIFSSLILFGKILVTIINSKLFEYDAVNFLFEGSDVDNKVSFYGRNFQININNASAKIFGEKRLHLEKTQNISKQRESNNNDQLDPNAIPDYLDNKINDSNKILPPNKDLVHENFDNMFDKSTFNLKEKEEFFLKNVQDHHIIKDNNIRSKIIDKKELEVNSNVIFPDFGREYKELNSKNIELSLNPNRLNINESNLITNMIGNKINSSISDSEKDNNILHDDNLINSRKTEEKNNNKDKDSILNDSIKRIVNKKLNLNPHKKDYVTFSNSEFFKTYLCIPKLKSKELLRKEIMFLSGREKICDYLNVLNYFNIYEELEKIKNIIFDENQNILFSFIRKRNYKEITDSDLEGRLSKSVKYYSSNKNYMNDPLGKKLVDKSIKEIQDLIYE